MHQFRIQAAQRAQRRERRLISEGTLAFVGQAGGVGLGQRHGYVAGAQQRDVFRAAAGDERGDPDLLRAAGAGKGTGKGHVLASVRPAGQRIAVLQPAQAAVDARHRAFQFLLHDMLRGAGGAVGDRVRDLVQRVQQLARDGGRRTAIQRGRFGGLETGGRDQGPGVAVLAVDRAGVSDDAVASLVAAGLDAADAARARAQQRHQRGGAGLVPGAERDVAVQPQFHVVIDHAPGFAGRRGAVRGRAAPLEVGDLELVRAVGGGQAALDVGAQRVGIGARPQAASVRQRAMRAMRLNMLTSLPRTAARSARSARSR